ncbi:MAG: triphosphoribosyl-dephospho-CoA synthase, partial [Casimicrobiaceae bacterium]
GLVSFVDSGSHRDMDARTFMRSLFALRHAFPRLAALGADGADFALLEREGIAAEARMMDATGGVNTHRGAIFTLGLLCASAGFLAARDATLVAPALRHALLERWGDALAQRRRATASHGASAARRFGLCDAGTAAAHGFPVLFEVTLPALRTALARGATPVDARLDALFHSIATVDDTNLAHRGGLAGLRFARRAARDFLGAGGANRPDGHAHARRVHRAFVARNLSPGGSADLLAAACWLQRVCAPAAATVAAPVAATVAVEVKVEVKENRGMRET